MKKYIFYTSVMLLGIFFLSCEKGTTGPSQGSSTRVYGGISPVGDYIAVTIDETNRTVTYNNYTTGEHAGPFAYSPSPLWGFQNIYRTEDFNAGGPPPFPCHAKFIVMQGVALIFQLFKSSNDSAIGWPVYAFSRVGINLNTVKGRSYNFMGCKINSTNGNYEAGFAGFDTDSIGFLYGAAYNHRADHEGWGGWDKGMSKINQRNTVSVSAFTYNPSIVAHEFFDGSDQLTLIGTQSGDFICDNGAGKGGSFAVRQASSKNWISNYNGTYLALVYENRAYAAAPIQHNMPMRITASGTGTITADRLDGTSIIPTYTGSFVPLEDFSGGPHYPPRTAIQDFEYYSRCDTARSDSIKNAYKCHGGFIDITTPNDCVVTVFFEPTGNFMFFCMFEKEGNGSYIYRFGFGIKDPNYVNP